MPNIKSLQSLTTKLSLLYVEDDVDLRINTAEIFEGLFKEVIVAENGEVALDLYNNYFIEHNNYINLVITDIQMPKMNGIELAKNILHINTNQVLFIISAYDDKEYLLELLNMEITGFIQKPFSLNMFISTLYSPCFKLLQTIEPLNIVELDHNYKWNHSDKSLYKESTKVILTNYETKLLELLMDDINKDFTSLEIFEYIYENDEEFSLDKIKSMFKRLRKKLPLNLILNTPQSGYRLNIPN